MEELLKQQMMGQNSAMSSEQMKLLIEHATQAQAQAQAHQTMMIIMFICF